MPFFSCKIMACLHQSQFSFSLKYYSLPDLLQKYSLTVGKCNAVQEPRTTDFEPLKKCERVGQVQGMFYVKESIYLSGFWLFLVILNKTRNRAKPQ